MAKVILISGKAEHGKTLAANVLKNLLESRGDKTLILSFADYLKFICMEYLGWDGKKDDKGRETLQYVGTDLIRNRDGDFWVNAVKNLVEVLKRDFDYFIIDDVRFVNELHAFMSIENLSIRIKRLNGDNTPFENSLSDTHRAHPSETGLDDVKHTFTRFVKTGEEYMVRNMSDLLELYPDI